MIIAGLLFAPESPVWLVKRGRIDAARASLRKLCNGPDAVVESHLTILVYTNDFEESLNAGTAYSDCFKGVNLRRTEISCGAWMMQVLTGVWFGSNIVYFMQRNGVSEAVSFNIGLGQSGLALVGTASAWWLMSLFGRRTLYLAGQSVMLGALLVVGFLGIPSPQATLNWVSPAKRMYIWLNPGVPVI